MSIIDDIDEIDEYEDKFEDVKIWQKYEDTLNKHNQMRLDLDREKSYKFVEGDQWFGMETCGENMAVYNFIKPIVDYRYNTVALQSMAIVFSDNDNKDDFLCTHFTKQIAQDWERNQVDDKLRKLLRDACIVGDSYLFFYDSKGNCQNIKNTDIFFADESDSDIQNQEWIIMRERRAVSKVKDEARANGVPEERIADILADEDDRLKSTNHYNDSKGSAKDDKCTCLVFLQKKDGFVEVTKVTRNVVYAPTYSIRSERGGMTLYPIVSLLWESKEGSSRGIGVVKPLIPNQIKCNENLMLRLIACKLTAYGRPVIAKDAVDNPEELFEAGSVIQVQNNSFEDIRKYITYLSPPPMSNDAHLLNQELIEKSQQLAGAGDAVNGAVDPTKTSGAAIIAARDQSALPLNEYVYSYKRMCEDIGRVYLDLWTTYHPDGEYVEDSNTGEQVYITPDAVEELKDKVKIDITPMDSYSKYALEQALENSMREKYITFEEYVKALPENSVAPKAKFEKILEQRAVAEPMQAQVGPDVPDIPMPEQSEDLDINEVMAELEQLKAGG